MTMRLINNRYKLNKLIYDSLEDSLYQGSDLWEGNRQLFIKFYNSEQSKNIIEYFVENFISLSKIKHKNLLSNFEFNITNTIDNKKVNFKQHFITTEYIKAPKLSEVHEDLSFKERLNILLQVANILDFLHYKGMVYRYLSPSNIYVLEDGSIKLMDLATICENILHTKYDDLTRGFIASEVLLQQENIIDKRADKYSFGVLALYLLTEDYYNYYGTKYKFLKKFNLTMEEEKFLRNLINPCLMKNPKLRDVRLRKIIHKLNERFNLNFHYDLVKERGVLDFQTKLVGRGNEIRKIMDIDRLVTDGKLDNKVILIKGGAGTGKTRFLKEISYLLRIRGRDVYSVEIGDRDESGLEAMTSILRTIIRDVPQSILDKYIEELSSLVPELKPDLGVDDPIVLNKQMESLRVFDRTTSFLKEVFSNRPVYLIFDNLENGNLQLLQMLDYLIRSIGSEKINIIASYNETALLDNSKEKQLIFKWLENPMVEEIEISNFTLEEIGECIQYILGISYKPLNFSAVILKESQGNPKYIEYIIKDLYASGELYFSPKGHWKVKTKKYSDIYFPTKLEETIKSQLNLIQDRHKNIMETIAVYYTAISKNTLQILINMEASELDKILKELVSMKLLDVRISDLGYAYSINDIQLKRNIYYNIPKNRRIKLHRVIANYLEEIYNQSNGFVLEELTYHLINSNDKVKALKYIVEKAREEEPYSFRSVSLWEEAYGIDEELDSPYAMEILENLGDIYTIKGENDKALEIYEKLLQKSKELGKIKYRVIANNGIADIYLKKNQLDLALKKVGESEKLTKEINDLDLSVETSVVRNRVLLEKGEFAQTEENVLQLLQTSLDNNLNKNLGNIYNLLGIIEFYKGNMNKALDLYKLSIKALEKVGDFLNSIKPRNNIANIYTQQGKLRQAMEYYKKCLNITKNREIANMQLILLNNIGSIYTTMHNYKKAIGYLESASILAAEVEDANLELLTNINLSIIYLLSGNYEQSYNYYIITKELVKNKDYNFEMRGYYYNYLSEIYYTFNQLEKAQKYSRKAIEKLKGFSIKEYLASKTRYLLIDYFINKVYCKKSIEEIRELYRQEGIELDRRLALLNLTLIPLVEYDYDYVQDILDEDAKISKGHKAPKLDYFRNILINTIKEDDESIEELIRLEIGMKKYNLPQLDLTLNIVLGMRFAKKEKYYEGLNYLLEALSMIRDLIKNIPDREFQIGLIRRFFGDTLKKEIANMLFKITNKKVDMIFLDEVKTEEGINKYFDHRPLIGLMSDEDFAKIREVSTYVDEDVKDINRLEDLISRLASDYKTNLELILKFLAKETFATKAYILGYDENTNRYSPFVSLDSNRDWLPNENLLSLANRYEKGILINGNMSETGKEQYREFLSQNSKALMCVPIRVKDGEGVYKGKERRSFFSYEVNEGYIYLETEKVFNRFDKIRQKLAYSLTQIIYMNLENYRLKILSNIDKLTGVSTRKYFEQEYGRIFNEAKRNQGDFAVLILDIDNFKDINDKYGHRKGDEVLEKIGGVLGSSVRSTDLVARYGGEEFIIVLKNIPENKAVEIGEKIRLDIANLKIPNSEDNITISIGIAIFPKHGQFKEELIEKADQALYSAKKKGKNKVILWKGHFLKPFDRIDRLAGIISGNIDQDQKNVVEILNTIDLVRENIPKEEKIFKFLDRLIKVVEGETASLIYLDREGEVVKSYSRVKNKSKWVDKVFINYNIVKEVLNEGKGKFLIDWDSIDNVNLSLNSPDWKSTIIYPIKFQGQVQGVVYITAPLKEKEFDYNCFNKIKVLSDIFSPIV